MDEQQDRLAEIKGPRDLLYGPNADPLHFIEIRLADLDWLVGECERLRGRLREIEWASSYVIDLPACPACGETEDTGHDPKCWLAAEIAKSDPQG